MEEQGDVHCILTTRSFSRYGRSMERAKPRSPRMRNWLEEDCYQYRSVVPLLAQVAGSLGCLAMITILSLAASFHPTLSRMWQWMMVMGRNSPAGE